MSLDTARSTERGQVLWQRSGLVTSSLKACSGASGAPGAPGKRAGRPGTSPRSPDTALAVSAHLYWTGAAADAYRAGDDSVRWILAEAAGGALFAGGHGA